MTPARIVGVLLMLLGAIVTLRALLVPYTVATVELVIGVLIGFVGWWLYSGGRAPR